MIPSDKELLAEYVRNGSENAFAQLVGRHVALVYSAALRKVRSSELAEEVAQTTFLKLAQLAKHLKTDTVLGAWLYQVAHRQAIDTVRREARRQNREQIVYQSMNMNAAPEADWSQLAPILDEAICSLNKAEKTALVLRYFENKSLREVGIALGGTENAAQKTVSRAIEGVRGFFSRRGISVTSGALSASLSVHAIDAVPLGLTASILSSTNAALLLPASSALFVKMFFMTTFQKSLIASAGIFAIATGLLNVRKILYPPTAAKPASAGEAKSVPPVRAEMPIKAALLSKFLPIAATDINDEKARINQILNATNWPSLTPQQIEDYLKTGRSAASLLAVFRANSDPAFLEEALQKYPDDPQVNFAALYGRSQTPSQRREQLEAFKKSAPDNALPNYLKAMDLIKSGENNGAVEELKSAAVKSEFTDYSMIFRQNAEEAYRSAGYPEAEAKVLASHSLLLPQLVDLSHFGQDMITLSETYRKGGDLESAQSILKLGVNLGQAIEFNTDDPTLTTRLLGASIERQSLRAMDPNQPFDASGRSVAERLDELTRERAAAQALAQQFEVAQPSMSPQDWLSYSDRVRTFGEKAAMQWIVDKYVTKTP